MNEDKRDGIIIVSSKSVSKLIGCNSVPFLYGNVGQRIDDGDRCVKNPQPILLPTKTTRTAAYLRDVSNTLGIRRLGTARLKDRDLPNHGCDDFPVFRCCEYRSDSSKSDKRADNDDELGDVRLQKVQQNDGYK